MSKHHPKQRGAHTWDLTVHYHSCPQCQKIIENRESYTYRLGSYIKDVECGRCGHAFTLKKRAKFSIGPFFGDGSTTEVEWE